jgi:hypothetical protein
VQFSDIKQVPRAKIKLENDRNTPKLKKKIKTYCSIPNTLKSDNRFNLSRKQTVWPQIPGDACEHIRQGNQVHYVPRCGIHNNPKLNSASSRATEYAEVGG